MLVVENLRVSYGRIRALHGINFSIDEGEIVCIIGANGAGKSTSLRAISRMVPVESGTRMIYKDEDLLKYPADKVVSKLGISHVPEGRRILDNLTVMENLKLATFARKDGAHKIERSGAGIFHLSPLGRKEKPKGRNLERRRAADAGDRQGLYEWQECDVTRRTLAWIGPAAGPGDIRNHPPHQ